MSASARVLVVGGGLSGLVAAWRLEDAGARVTLLESRERLGGRSAEPGEDVPARLVPERAPVLSGLVAELGLDERLRRTPCAAARLGARGGPGGWWARRRLRGLLDYYGGELDPGAPERGLRLDDRSAADFARLYFGRAVLRDEVVPLFAELGLDAEETSRLVLLLTMDAFGDVALGRAHGLDALAAELGKRLSDVRTGARAAAVGPGGRATLASGETLRGDAVLIATPAPDALLLAPAPAPAEERFLRRVHYGRPGAVPAFPVGHFRGAARLRAEQAKRFAERRWLLCGDYLALPHAEGAAAAGTRAAAELLARLQ